MKKVLFLLVFSFAFINMTKADVTAVEEPIILNEKIDNPISGHGGPSKSPTFFYVYQSGHVFTFGQYLVGCTVSFDANDTVVFSTVVDENGQVTVPANMSGIFELQLTVGNIVYWAEILL